MNLFAEADLNTRSRITWTPPTFPRLTDEKDIFLDFETTGLRWWQDKPVGVALGWGECETEYFPFGHRGGGNLDEGNVKTFLRSLRGKRIIGQNVKFDAHIAREWGVDFEAQDCSLADTSHCAALLDDNRHAFNLDALAKDFLGADRGKVKRTAFTNDEINPKRMASYHSAEIAPYAREDVNLTRDLWRVFTPRVANENLGDVLDLECELLYVVLGMEKNPPLLDVEKLDRWEVETQDKLNAILLEIHSETGIMLNTNSANNWAALFEARGIPVPTDRTKGGKKTAPRPSYSAAVLKRIKDPIIVLATQAKDLESLRDKYIVSYQQRRDPSGHLRTNLHQLKCDPKGEGGGGGTVSGRFSSTSYKFDTDKVGANLQQVFAAAKQREKFGDNYIIRELFIPERGIWFSIDAAQIEYRLFAHYANNPAVIAAYDANPGLSYHEFVWEMVKPFKPDIAYKATKNLNFAKIYGAGKEKVADMLGLPLSESNQFVKIYEREIPEAKTLMNSASETARMRGFVRTIMNRRARFPGARRLHKALNSIIQGGAADIMKKKAIRAHEAIRRREIDARLTLTVHDELDGDTPNLEEAQKLERLLNEQDFDLRVPILWKLNTGANWAECE
jgi:DNA polymerase-1